jgi:hypothetical protein
LFKLYKQNIQQNKLIKVSQGLTFSQKSHEILKNGDGSTMTNDQGQEVDKVKNMHFPQALTAKR